MTVLVVASCGDDPPSRELPANFRASDLSGRSFVLEFEKATSVPGRGSDRVTMVISASSDGRLTELTSLVVRGGTAVSRSRFDRAANALRIEDLASCEQMSERAPSDLDILAVVADAIGPPHPYEMRGWIRRGDHEATSVDADFDYLLSDDRSLSLTGRRLVMSPRRGDIEVVVDRISMVRVANAGRDAALQQLAGPQCGG